MSNLHGIIINQQLKQQQSPFALSVLSVTRVTVYHQWKAAGLAAPLPRHAAQPSPNQGRGAAKDFWAQGSLEQKLCLISKRRKG